MTPTMKRPVVLAGLCMRVVIEFAPCGANCRYRVQATRHDDATCTPYMHAARVVAIRRNDDAFTQASARAFAWCVELVCIMARSRPCLAWPLR